MGEPNLAGTEIDRLWNFVVQVPKLNSRIRLNPSICGICLREIMLWLSLE